MMTFNPCTNTIKVIMVILVLLTEEMGSEFNSLPEAIESQELSPDLTGGGSWILVQV